MGRPPKLSGDLVSISVHGKGAAWCDGVFAGDPEILEAARLAIRLELPVMIGRERYEAGGEDALGALAALMSYSSQALIIQAPNYISQILSQDAENPAETWAEPDVPLAR